MKGFTVLPNGKNIVIVISYDRKNSSDIQSLPTSKNLIKDLIKDKTSFGENMIKFYDYNYSIPYEHAIDQWAKSKKYSDGNKVWTKKNRK